jgi:hypothetical protein
MKKILISFTTALIIASCTEKKVETNTHITGNIKGLSSGMLYLQKMTDSVSIAIDSLKIDGDSKFKFDFNLESPEMMYLVLDRGVTNSIDNSLPIFVEQGSINVDTELKYFYANAKVTGSKNHELLEEFKKVNGGFKNELLQISKEKFDAVRFNRLKDVDSITKKYDNRLSRKYLYAINFAITNKEHEVAPYVALTELINANPKYLDTIENSMSAKVKESKYGKLLTSYTKELKRN